MLRRISSSRPSPPTLIALVALFFGLTGTGIAASRYVITSTSQIKPSVLRELRHTVTEELVGTPGPVGPPGPQGATGSQGPAAPFELKIKEGKGPEEYRGERGFEGKEGPPGPRGEPGPVGPHGEMGERGREGPAANPQEGTRGTERLHSGDEEQDATATCPNDEWIALGGGWETTGGVYVTASYRTASHHGWVVTGALLNHSGNGTVTAIVYCVPDEVTLEG